MAQLGDRIAPGDRDILERMLRYFDRSSLWLARAEGSGEDLVLYLANEAERFRLPLATLRALYQGMKQGRAVDWDNLERIR